uniref:ARID domain-containing protein n=1 Tax=Caenorhabditis tropicalis TaxID=1561998 RepID=A0A1I7UQZ2_9PELO
MESRKRKSELELYIDTLTDPPEKQRKAAEFYNSLRQFYKRRWNAPLRLPHVQGVEVNLFRLYDTVMALGGWQKVAACDKWSDIAEMFGCKDDIVCGDHAIKILYMRYLSKFEQVETIGDVDDYVDNEMSRSRGRNATSFFATNDCPISYSRMHPEQPPRDERGQIITDPDYARLVKSLMSGLPNEVDFAMNVSMLLSHAGPKQLRICHAPTLLTLLVAHTGVYDEEDKAMQKLGDDWKKTTRHNYRRFWASSGVPLDLLVRFVDPEIAAEYVEASEDDDFFTGVTETFNVKDPRCWRLNQVTTIIRNLSFESANRVTIVKTWPVMKFLIMCASCRWAPLYVAAMDALSNLATDIDLADKTLVYVSQHAILRLIHEGIFSMDKLKLIRSLEILGSLCGFEGNEAIICDWLRADTISHIFEIVGVKDIMMCVYTLECLYQISEMGDTACDLIAESPKAIQQLVSMATLEAVSFGPAGLAGMKVVEYQPTFSQAPPQQPVHPAFRPGPSQPPPPVTPAPPMTVRQVIQNNLALQQVQRESQQVPPSPTIQAPPTVFSNGSSSSRKHLPVRPIIPESNPAQTEEEKRLEKLTVEWIKKNLVFEPSICTARGDLYSVYVDDLRNHHHSTSGSLPMFSGVMKNLYPDVVFRMADNGVMIVAQGIRLVRPHRLAPSSTTTCNPSTADSHPLMKKMLTDPEPPMENGINGHSVDATSSSEDDGSSNEVEMKKDFLEQNENAKKILTNGTMEVCQAPIQAAKLFDDDENRKNEEVPIERREQFVNDDTPPPQKTEQPMTNGVAPMCNGNHHKPKKDTVASRAAHIVAVAAACNGDLEKINGVKEEPITVEKKWVPVSSQPTDYMCDWDCCSKFYSSPSHVLKHLSEEHVAEELRVLCRWNGCTDPTPRNRWSLITHIQDSHCNEAQLKASAQRRREGGVVRVTRPDVVARDMNNHPGYAKNAAFDAIRRHAFNFLSRELTEEAEGPVTKSIRLTSCLILRNLARYSADGRQKLRRHESHLCWLALSRLESSHALSQLLSELHQTPSAEEDQLVPKPISQAPSSASLSSMPGGAGGSSSQLPTIPDSPTSSTLVTTPLRKPVSFSAGGGAKPQPPVNRMINFSALSTEKTTEKTTSSSSSTSSAQFTATATTRHALQQHLPSQPSPLVQKTTPVRAGAGN